jgi:chemotaxis response regulator CheB
MTTLREKVAGERRRLKSVREAMTTAVARKSGGDASFVPFYVAVADYIETSMGRLHAQDVKMGNMIREKLGKLDAQAEKALRELDERLAGNQDHLKAFSAAKLALKTGGPAALEAFEAVGAAYSNFIVTNMGHHGATTELAQRLFTTADWDYMAGVTDEETRVEQQLYARVFAALPAALHDLRPAS